MNSTLLKKQNNEQLTKRLFVAFAFLFSLAVFLFAFSEIAFAATLNPLESIERLKELFGQFVSALGVIATLIGVLICGLGFMSHDPSQKVTGAVTMAVGIFIAGATWVVSYLTSAE